MGGQTIRIALSHLCKITKNRGYLQAQTSTRPLRILCSLLYTKAYLNNLHGPLSRKEWTGMPNVWL